MSELTLHICLEPHCMLGQRDAPGRFTGGISQEYAIMLTGNPDAPYGDGVCPNCGAPGTPSADWKDRPEGEGATHESVTGEEANDG